MDYKRKWLGTLGLLLMLAVSLSACQTYNIGGTLEPRTKANTQGMFWAGDWIDEYGEWAMVYFPDAQPEVPGAKENYGLGIDAMYKYPFHIAGNHFSIFPMLGMDFRYFDPVQPEKIVDEWGDDITPSLTLGNYMGMSFKFGGGFDINFTKSFYFRGKALYAPEKLSFMESVPGPRFSLALGYRTADDDVRSGFKTFKNLRIDNALKAARESFEKKNYDGAVVNYRKAISFGASLNETSIANLSTSLYERAKENRNKGDYRQALDDLNASMQHQYFMSRQKYSDWIDTVDLYEQTSGQNAPHGGYGKLIFPMNDNLTISYDRGSNGQTSPNETDGNGWNLNLPAGRRIFSLAYDEPNYDRGYLKSDSVRVTLEVEEGHIYRAAGNVSDSQVTITITDVTNSELGKNFDISSNPIFSRILALVEERPKQESVNITIVNNTGYSVWYMYISPADSDRWGADVLGLAEVFSNKSSRKVTLPPLNTSRKYDIRLKDKDGDTYTKWGVTISQNAVITFTILDIDL